MQESIKFSGAEANVVVHATEDKDRILAAIQSQLNLPADSFIESIADGHYKNKILMLKAVFSSEEAGQLASRMAAKLSSSDREEIWHNIRQLSDEKGNLFLRIDKQRLCQGKVSITSADSLRIKFKPIKRYRPASSLESYRGLFTSE